MLPPSIDEIWRRYLRAEEDRVRPVSLAFLEEFLVAVRGIPVSDRQTWARDVARRVVDEDCALPVRLPLFEQVLFPALLAGLRSGEPGCARWLAGFHLLIHQSPACRDQLEPDERAEVALLREAIRLDGDDRLARGRLVRALGDRLEYSLHELPTGVLHDSDFASTPEQCRELEEELAEFEALVEAHGARPEHSELIAACRYHYRHYGEYLRRRRDFGSYGEYLGTAGEA